MSVYDVKGTTTLFSGRFCPVHAGHIVSISRIGVNHRVIVMVLDYPNQQYPVAYRMQVLKEILSRMKGGPYTVLSNKTHFGKMNAEELTRYPKFDFYSSGNLDCVKHMESLGYKCYYVERAYEYAATNDRVAKAVMEALER